MTLLEHTDPATTLEGTTSTNTLEETTSINALEATNATSALGTSEVSDERFLAECFKNIEGFPTIMMDAVADACGMQDWNSATTRLVDLTTKHHIFKRTPGIIASRVVKLDPTAIATGGPATVFDRVTKHPTSIANKQGMVRIVRKCDHKFGASAHYQIPVTEARSSQEELACGGADDTARSSGWASELTYFSSTQKNSSISIDSHSRPFPGVTRDQMEDNGVTASHLIYAKKARKNGTMAKLLADKTPEQIAKYRAAEELLKRAEENRKAAENSKADEKSKAGDSSKVEKSM